MSLSFTAPLGAWNAPATIANPIEIYDQLTLKAMYLAPGEGLAVDPGCASRDDGGTWIPLVIAHLGDADFYMTPACAREIAVRVAGNPQFDVVFGDAAQVGLCFTQAADKAEALAAGQASSANPQEIH